MFRSAGAVVVWWIWVLFAVGNLIDLAVQGRDHLSLVAAFILLFVTGIVYITALRPRLIADEDGLTIANPVRDHRVGWAAVAGADPTDLLRVRCEWPEGTGRPGGPSTPGRCTPRGAGRSPPRCARGASPGQGARAASAGSLVGGGFGLAGAFGSAASSPEGDPLRLDAGKVVATLSERGAEARLDAAGHPGGRPGLDLGLARRGGGRHPWACPAGHRARVARAPVSFATRGAGWTAGRSASRCSRRARPP